MPPLRLGLIGTGLFVQKSHLPALAALEDRFEVRAVCSERGASAKAVASRLPSRPIVEPDHRTLLARHDLDVVLVATPIHRTAPIVRDAIVAGKAVISEKPVAETVAQAAELLRLGRERGVPHLVAENVRYQGRFLAARALLEAGRIGRPSVYQVEVTSRMLPDNPYAASRWRREQYHQGGWLVDSGVHTAAALRQISSAEPTRVFAVTRSIDPATLGDQPDTLLATIDMDDGSVAHLTHSLAILGRWTNALRVSGAEGTLSLLQERRYEDGRPRYDDWIEIATDEQTPPERVALEDSLGGFRQEWEDFHLALTTGAPALGIAWEAARDLQLIDAALASAERGAAITIPLEIAAPWRQKQGPAPS